MYEGSTSPRDDEHRKRKHDDDDGEYRHRKRSRSNSYDREHRRSRSHKSSRRSHHKHKSRSRSPSHEHSRHDRQHREDRDYKRRHREVTPEENYQSVIFEEIKPGDREKRTVMISRLPSTVTEADVIDFFAPVGRVREVKLIRDRFTGKSKGYGFVEFYEDSSIYPAIQQNGKPLRGFPVMIKAAEIDKTLALNPQPQSQGITKLYIGEIPPPLTESDLRELFEAVGVVEHIEIRKDEKGESKHYGFVKFRKPEEARKALLKMNGLRLYNDYRIQVGLWNEAKAMEVSLTENSHEYDIEGDTSLTAQQRRDMVQQNLGQFKTAASAPVNSDDQFATRNIRLSNMFDPATETGDFENEIKMDVADECSKFGRICHIYVDKNSAGHVYVRFDNSAAAKQAHQALNGRWFAKKMIGSEFLADITYITKFPEARGT
jgi:RNA-binding protein 39